MSEESDPDVELARRKILQSSVGLAAFGTTGLVGNVSAEENGGQNKKTNWF